MGEYKKADEIVKNMTKKFDKKYGDTTIKGIRDVFNMCVNCVNQTPTTDVVEAKRGEWIYHECVSSYDGAKSGYSCSVCSAFVNDEVFESDGFHKDFCGHCGADMRGENDG